MSRVMQNSVTISALPATVWDVLTAFDQRSEWDPYYREVRGEFAHGARLTVRASLNDTSGVVTSHPRIVLLDPDTCLAWSNRFVLPGLLDSRNEFRLSSSRTGVTRLQQTERFSGLMVKPARRMLDDVEHRLHQWIIAIKRRAEEPTRTAPVP